MRSTMRKLMDLIDLLDMVRFPNSWLLAIAGAALTLLACGVTQAADPALPVDGPVSIARSLQDYGMAAVAGILLWAAWRGNERMAAALDRHEQCLIELVRQNAVVAERQICESAALRDEMRKRPCLTGLPTLEREAKA